MKIIIPNDVKFIIKQLNQHGYEAFAVGGCVRDSLLSIVPNDWDICTNARPEQTKSCFADFTTFDSGIKHGTISVVHNHQVYEITTYRIDGEYSDNRHPENVTFTSDIDMDLSRRDFTVNAMAYNEERGLIDPFNGKADIQKKIIRCVGSPDRRFNEDALRIIRALRFASTYSFSIEELTSKSILSNAELLNNIAVERIAVELNKLLCGNGAEKILNNYRDVVAVVIPELKSEFNFNQHSKHHNLDLWHHTTRSIALVDNDPRLKMTMLLHDIAKPQCCTTDENGEFHFYNHPKLGAQLSLQILRRLKYSNEFSHECVQLIENHDLRYTGSKRQLKRMLSKIGETNLRSLLKVQRADVLAQSDYMRAEKLEQIALAQKDLDKLIEENACFSLKQLAVNGRDLIAIGVTDGKEIGRILKELLNLVVDDKIKNDKETLVSEVKKQFQQKNP
jgi:tRNA nucleotidyltransferase (CCA-adding enzyme)